MFTIFIAGVVLAGLTGCLLLCRRQPRLGDRLVLALLPVVLIVLAFTFVRFFLDNYFSTSAWPNARMANTVGLLHGYWLYYPLDSGPVLTAMYTPLAHLVYLPVGLTRTPAAAIFFGDLLTLAFVLIPTAYLFLAGRRMAPGERLFRLYAFAAFSFLMLASSETRLVFFNVHPDGPALGFLVAAGALLCTAGRGPALSRLVASSVFAALALWTKQTTVAGVFGLALWVLVALGWQAFFRYAAFLALSFGTIFAVLAALVSLNDLTLNVVTIPNAFPWMKTSSVPLLNLARVALELQESALPLVLILATGIIVRLKLPAATRKAYPRVVLRSSWALFAIVGLATVPMAILGRVKYGGTANHFVPPLYCIGLAVVLMLIEAFNRPLYPALARQVFKSVFFVFLAGVAVVAAQETAWALRDMPQRHDLHEQSFAFIQKHPGQVYFPWHPLSHLMAEGKMYHFGCALLDREVADLPVTTDHFARHIPEDVRLICLPPATRFTAEYELQAKCLRDHLKVLPKPVEVEGLPGWVCYERVDGSAHPR